MAVNEAHCHSELFSSVSLVGRRFQQFFSLSCVQVPRPDGACSPVRNVSTLRQAANVSDGVADPVALRFAIPKPATRLTPVDKLSTGPGRLEKKVKQRIKE